MFRFFVFKQKTAYEMLRSLVVKQKTAYEMLRSLVGSEMCIRDSALAECPDQAGDVGGQGVGVVPARWLVARAVSAQVGRYHSAAGGRKVPELMPPAPPELRKAVEQQDQRAAARLGDMEPGAVRADLTMLPGAGNQNCCLRRNWRLGGSRRSHSGRVAHPRRQVQCVRPAAARRGPVSDGAPRRCRP